MSVFVRFAPSPTGRLHVGNLRLALVNWLFARANQGRFMLRLDDTDTARSSEEYVTAIQEDLTWMGLHWDQQARQSERQSVYDDIAEQLKKTGHLYPCYETPEELSLKRKSLLGRGKPPVYDRAALSLTEQDKKKLEQEGRKPHWRFKLQDKPIIWTDLAVGEMRFEGSALSDPVLIRADGRPLYTLPSCIDDVEFGITHVVRGEDHLTNTATQIQLFEVLNTVMKNGKGTCPAFAHLSLLMHENGAPLSKRLGSLSLAQLREEEGVEAMALSSLLAKLGTSDSVQPVATLDALAADFSFDKFSRASPRFNLEDVRRLNHHLLQDMNLSDVKDRLAAMGLNDVEDMLWQQARPNITVLKDFEQWWNVCHAAVTPHIEDPDFARQAAALLPGGKWDQNTWQEWTKAVKEKTGNRGKALFLPLRKALTGYDHGPELKYLLPLIGREKALARLSGQTA